MGLGRCPRRTANGQCAAIGDCPSFPRNETSFSQLIEIFVLEKALYEICYEAANRSDWIHIPLVGVVEIICHGK
jgi:maltose alpha-D-glucosyltransferase / alpha-amylase